MKEADILNFEKQLLLADVRSSAERLAELLADEYIEYCSSGEIYRYQRGDTFGYGLQRDWEIFVFVA